jgi:hypothetical protein
MTAARDSPSFIESESSPSFMGLEFSPFLLPALGAVPAVMFFSACGAAPAVSHLDPLGVSELGVDRCAGSPLGGDRLGGCALGVDRLGGVICCSSAGRLTGRMVLGVDAYPSFLACGSVPVVVSACSRLRLGVIDPRSFSACSRRLVGLNLIVMSAALLPVAEVRGVTRVRRVVAGSAPSPSTAVPALVLAAPLGHSAVVSDEEEGDLDDESKSPHLVDNEDESKSPAFLGPDDSDTKSEVEFDEEATLLAAQARLVREEAQLLRDQRVVDIRLDVERRSATVASLREDVGSPAPVSAVPTAVPATVNQTPVRSGLRPKVLAYQSALSRKPPTPAALLRQACISELPELVPSQVPRFRPDEGEEDDDVRSPYLLLSHGSEADVGRRCASSVCSRPRLVAWVGSSYPCSLLTSGSDLHVLNACPLEAEVSHPSGPTSVGEPREEDKDQAMCVVDLDGRDSESELVNDEAQRSAAVVPPATEGCMVMPSHAVEADLPLCLGLPDPSRVLPSLRTQETVVDEEAHPLRVGVDCSEAAPSSRLIPLESEYFVGDLVKLQKSEARGADEVNGRQRASHALSDRPIDRSRGSAPCQAVGEQPTRATREVVAVWGRSCAATPHLHGADGLLVGVIAEVEEEREDLGLPEDRGSDLNRPELGGKDDEDAQRFLGDMALWYSRNAPRPSSFRRMLVFQGFVSGQRAIVLLDLGVNAYVVSHYWARSRGLQERPTRTAKEAAVIRGRPCAATSRLRGEEGLLDVVIPEDQDLCRLSTGMSWSGVGPGRLDESMDGDADLLSRPEMMFGNLARTSATGLGRAAVITAFDQIGPRCREEPAVSTAYGLRQWQVRLLGSTPALVVLERELGGGLKAWFEESRTASIHDILRFSCTAVEHRLRMLSSDGAAMMAMMTQSDLLCGGLREGYADRYSAQASLEWVSAARPLQVGRCRCSVADAHGRSGGEAGDAAEIGARPRTGQDEAVDARSRLEAAGFTGSKVPMRAEAVPSSVGPWSLVRKGAELQVLLDETCGVWWLARPEQLGLGTRGCVLWSPLRRLSIPMDGKARTTMVRELSDDPTEGQPGRGEAHGPRIAARLYEQGLYGGVIGYMRSRVCGVVEEDRWGSSYAMSIPARRWELVSWSLVARLPRWTGGDHHCLRGTVEVVYRQETCLVCCTKMAVGSDVAMRVRAHLVQLPDGITQRELMAAARTPAAVMRMTSVAVHVQATRTALAEAWAWPEEATSGHREKVSNFAHRGPAAGRGFRGVTIVVVKGHSPRVRVCPGRRPSSRPSPVRVSDDGRALGEYEREDLLGKKEELEGSSSSAVDEPSYTLVMRRGKVRNVMALGLMVERTGYVLEDDGRQRITSVVGRADLVGDYKTATGPRGGDQCPSVSVDVVLWKRECRYRCLPPHMCERGLVSRRRFEASRPNRLSPFDRPSTQVFCRYSQASKPSGGREKRERSFPYDRSGPEAEISKSFGVSGQV